MRTMLRRSIIFLTGSGLLAVVYATRPDVPSGSATSPQQQPAAPARSSSTDTARPFAMGLAPNAFGADAVKPIFSDLHSATSRPADAKGLDADAPRAELARAPRSVGWGDSYAVRVLNPAGRPIVVAEIVLIAHMGNGTVENIAMGALPEPGIYRATVPAGRSVPISLQVRISYGGKRVELPVRRS